MKIASKALNVIFIISLVTVGLTLPDKLPSTQLIPVTSRVVEQGEYHIPDSVLYGPTPEIPSSARPVAVDIPGHTYPVVQQPDGQPGYVSVDPTVVTEFSLASEAGATIGLLAHNFLAGGAFLNIDRGQQVGLYFPQGIYRLYRVVQVLEYQALEPYSVYSDFINLSAPGKVMDSTQVFKQVYQQGDRLVLQTCIERNGNDSWGRLFVVAMPVRAMASTTWISSVG